MDFSLTEEQRSIVAVTRSFVERELYPHEQEVERTGVLRRRIRSMGSFRYEVVLPADAPYLSNLAALWVTDPALAARIEALAPAGDRGPLRPALVPRRPRASGDDRRGRRRPPDAPLVRGA